jgi:type 1 glutamine amidotransferase
MVKKSQSICATILLLLAMISLIFTSCQSQSATTQPVAISSANPIATVGPTKVLVFSKTGAFRHASIKDGIAAIQILAAEHHIVADFTEDATFFTDANLSQYKAVVFLLTSGNIFDDNQKAAFEHYIRAGGGYAGVHSASDTEYNWSWYGQLVGAYFRSHPSVRQATVDVVDNKHPSTVMLPKQWVRTDEWYNFRTNPRGSVHVLMTMDEKTYQGGTMGADHPIAWYHQYDGGRAWYTALGHTSESYTEPLFLAHLWGGIAYAAGLGTQ